MSKKETGLMFKAPLVRAILSGQKTQTRRAFSGHMVKQMRAAAAIGEVSHFLDEEILQPNDLAYVQQFSPVGEPGDRIYVRETFGYGGDAYTPDIYFRADQPEAPIQGCWNPAIHMRKADARIWLDVTGVRVERLQDITEADADAEGCERLDAERYERDWTLCPKCGGTRLHDALGSGGGVIHDVDCLECDTYVKRFRHLWESTGGDWSANPWVWVIDFKRIGAT